MFLSGTFYYIGINLAVILAQLFNVSDSNGIPPLAVQSDTCPTGNHLTGIKQICVT